MINQRIVSSTSMLGVGLLTMVMAAPIALAGGKPLGDQCPFNSKYLDDIYLQTGLDPKDPDAGMNGAIDCQGDEVGAVQASISQTSKVPDFVVFENETVPALKMDKYFFVFVDAEGPDGDKIGSWHIKAFGDGFSHGPTDAWFSSDAQAQNCLNEVRSSQAFTRWVCPKE